MKPHDGLARRLVDKQIDTATQQLARDVVQLVKTSTQYAADLTRSGPHAGEAARIAEMAQRLATAAARLDGIREIAALLPETEEPGR